MPWIRPALVRRPAKHPTLEEALACSGNLVTTAEPCRPPATAREDGRGLILVTHDHVLARRADHVYLLDGGRLAPAGADSDPS